MVTGSNDRPLMDVVISVLVVTVVVVNGRDAETQCCITVDVFIKLASEVSHPPLPW